MSTNRVFKDTLKNKVYLYLHELFMRWSQWFIVHCDMEEFSFEEMK